MKVLTNIIFKNDRRREKISKTGISGRLLSFLSFAIVFGALSAFMIWASIYITTKLRDIDQTFSFINIMLLGNFGILFVESIFQAINILYFSKDLKVFLRMPIKSKDIVHAKLLKIITSGYEMETIMLAIPMIVYGIMTKVSFQFYLYIPIILLILPVIPVCITAVIVAIIMRFTNTLKNKSKAMYITIIMATFLVDIIISMLGNKVSVSHMFSDDVIVTKNGLATEIGNQFKLIIPIMNTFLNYNSIKGLKLICLYCLASFVIYVGALGIISPIYLKGAIGSVINGNRKLNKYKDKLTMDDFKEKDYKKSYLLKEYYMICRSPIFFIQCLVFPVILSVVVLAMATSLFAFSMGIGFNVVSRMTGLISKPWFSGGFLSMSQVFYMINFTSIIALSKEEKWAVLSKYIPIKFSRQINLKLRMGKITNFFTSITVVLLYYTCTENIVNTIFVLLISLGFNFFGEKIKILIDLKNPKTDWDNEYTMMKQNTNVMYELFYTMILITIFVGLGFIIKNNTVYFILISIMAIGLNVVMNKYLFDNDAKLFEKVF